MSERDIYPAGVPCWVETLQHDRRAAQAFYASLFGWQIVASEEDEYAVARIGGCDVAGIGALPAADPSASWITHIRVDGLEAAVRCAGAAGGSVQQAAIDADPAGRFAVIADPAGAVFCLWEAGIREGAQRSTNRARGP